MAPFTPAALRSFEPEIRRRTKQIIDKSLEQPEVEFVFEVASRLPVYTFCTLMGIPDEDHEKIFKLGNEVIDGENPKANWRAAQAELYAYSNMLSEKKRANPDGSILSRYVNETIDGYRLSQAEVNSFFHQISVAGHETTRGTTAHFIHMMATHPDQLAYLREDLEGRLPNAIEEVLRFCPPVLKFRRTAMEDVELGGKTIRKGDKVYLSYPAANRDPEIFEEPDRFDVSRKNARLHMSFGMGPHFCIGATLARLQLNIFLREWLSRVSSFEIVGQPKWQPSILLNSILELNVRAKKKLQ